ncbi:Camp responsive element modulator, partial [Globisporangium splendens]
MDTRSDSASSAHPEGRRSSSARNDSSNSPPVGGMMSGIDWSIFKDSEEDAFGWLLRTNAAAAPATPENSVASDAVALPLLSTDALSLEEIQMDDNEESMLGLERSVSAKPSSSPTDPKIKQEGVANHALTANSLAAHLHSNAGRAKRSNKYRQPPPSQFDANISIDGSYDDLGDDDDFVDETGYNSDDQQSIVSHGTTPRPSARSENKGKRAIKRKKSVASENADGEDLGEDQDKKQQRRVKNLASVREFRKRKMKQMEQNEHRLRRLEAENLDLKMRLKIGKEAIISEQREKQQIKEQMREMLQHNASEQEIARFLNMYKVTYSDYGPKRREKLRFHLERIRELLLPTQVTKLCLYSVEQGKDMIARDHVIKEDPMSMSDSSAAPMSLWGILAKELDVSDAQQRQILERRTSIKKVQDDLNHTLSILSQLEQVTDEKNTALETQVAELQQILTPSQATKFIIWVKENPAFMYMLDKLVDKTLRNTDA